MSTLLQQGGNKRRKFIEDFSVQVPKLHLLPRREQGDVPSPKATGKDTSKWSNSVERKRGDFEVNQEIYSDVPCGVTSDTPFPTLRSPPTDGP
jgi:hypothetical protein